jgi:hypothetical protein
MIEMKLKEALDIFLKWRSEDADVLCVGTRFSGWSFSVRGKVTSINNSGVTISSGLSEKATGAITVNLATEDMLLYYAETREAKLEQDAPVLVIGLPLRVPPSDLNTPITPAREMLTFVAMPVES